jgi:hypothetical protein
MSRRRTTCCSVWAWAGTANRERSGVQTITWLFAPTPLLALNTSSAIYITV